MAFSAGTNAKLKLHDGTSLVDVSAYLKTAGINRQRDMYDTTTLGDSDREFVGGLRSNTFQLEGPFDPTIDALMAGALSADARAFEYYPVGEPVGVTKPKYSGSYLVASYDVSTPVDDMAQFSAEIQFTGAITRATA